MSDELKVKAQRLGQLLANSTTLDLDQKMRILGLLKGMTEGQIDSLIIYLDEGIGDLELILAI
ncbi:MAG: hypothetical protein WCV68_00150 [Candidatus Paceibacterota bacterium]|jgi:hypothetical protein